MVKCFGVKFERALSDFRKSLAGQVVCGWTEASCHDHNVGTIGGDPKHIHFMLKCVAHGTVKRDSDTKVAKALAYPSRVRVEPLPAGHFVANRNDFGR
jgi:acetyl-CoA carboxylase carboxyltransferase component